VAQQERITCDEPHRRLRREGARDYAAHADKTASLANLRDQMLLGLSDIVSRQTRSAPDCKDHLTRQVLGFADLSHPMIDHR
jgi:hypothetical protein